jgi:hypothetical protein
MAMDPLSPCTSQDELDYGAEVPLSPPRCWMEKEGFEVVMPLSPTSAMDVFVLMDDDQIQHVKPTEDSCYYVSDASETVSLAMSSVRGSLLGPSFLSEESAPPIAKELSIPRLIFPSSLQADSVVVTGKNTPSSGSPKRDTIVYTYSEDDEDEDEEEADLVGLRCLPEAFCAPLGGFLEEDSWESFWGNGLTTYKIVGED